MEKLNVLICSDYSFIFNWMSFAAWYSIRKNLPTADVALLSARSGFNMQLYNWANKASVKFFLHRDIGKKNGLPYLNKIFSTYIAVKEGLVKQPFIVIDADMMALRGLSDSVINSLANCKFATNKSPMGPIWYFNDQPLEKFTEVINRIKVIQKTDHLDWAALLEVFGEPVVVDGLGNEVYEESLATFTHYKEKCGNFRRKDYEKGVVSPPFKDQMTLRTLEMSINERKVFNLWAQMWTAFEALSK